MIDCDYVITSNGRTVFEVASLGIPLISLSVNKRERQHNFVVNKKVGYHIDFTRKESDLILKKCIKQMEKIENQEKFIFNLQKQNLREGIDKVTSKGFTNSTFIKDSILYKNLIEKIYVVIIKSSPAIFNEAAETIDENKNQ